MSNKKITIKAEMEERWMPYFLSMLDMMESCGRNGQSRVVAIYADGDGGFQPRFTFSEEFEMQQPIRDNNGHLLFDAE